MRENLGSWAHLGALFQVMLFSLQPDPTPRTISVDVALAAFLTYSFSVAAWTCAAVME